MDVLDAVMLIISDIIETIFGPAETMSNILLTLIKLLIQGAVAIVETLQNIFDVLANL